MLGDVLGYLTDGANWSGSTGIGAFATQQLLLTVTALLVAMVLGLPLALYLGHRRRGGFLAVNISNVGRAVPVFAVLLILSRGPVGTDQLGPYGRAGLATLIALAALRAPAADHQRLRRRHRGGPRRRRGGLRTGDERPQGVHRRRAATGDAGGHDRGPDRAGAGLGDRDHRGAGRRPGAGPDHHPGVRQPGDVPGGGRRAAGRCRRAACSRASPSWRSGALDPMRRVSRQATVRRASIARRNGLSVARG